jgi:hypothetical protein
MALFLAIFIVKCVVCKLFKNLNLMALVSIVYEIAINVIIG